MSNNTINYILSEYSNKGEVEPSVQKTLKQKYRFDENYNDVASVCMTFIR